MSIPILTHFGKPRRYVHASARYNATGQQLDIWGPTSPDAPAPVLLFVPGGGWMIGHRRGQAHELMSHLVDQGWICVAISYRTAPRDHWPAPFDDVKSAMRWIRRYIEDFGGDPDFVAIAGASAGGHMASLAGLTFTTFTDKPDAVVSLYGVYDWESRGTVYREGFLRILEKVIVGKSQRRHPKIFRDASPVNHVRPDAPPFLIIHGTSDFLTPVSGARRFNEKLSAVSKEVVAYHEIRGGQHAFDLINSRQSRDAITLIDEFLADVRQKEMVAA